MFKRPRRNRMYSAIRNLVQENHIRPSNFVAPLFLLPGDKHQIAIPEMPGIHRRSLDLLLKEAEELHKQGVQAISLFPIIDPKLKDEHGHESFNDEGLIPTAIAKIKNELPSLCVLTDVALDPYTSHGHDGIINIKREIDNDATLEVLIKQALSQARAGTDFIAPSDMMDGRVKMIRQALDAEGFNHVGILSYAAKYASTFYAPFRRAIQVELAFGDKNTYQLNPANSREAILEAMIDEEEGADMLMVKPALPYLDIISKLRENTNLPIAAYQVSGEYAMVMAAHEKGYLDAHKVFYESILSIKRAGADFIYTYAIKHILEMIK